MRIGELANLAGVSTKTIRGYESIGLINATRLANGYRDFGEHHVQLVREVRELNRLGIAVRRTRPFVDCLAHGSELGDDCPSALAEYRDAIDELSAQIVNLTARKEALSRRLQDAAKRRPQQASSEPPLFRYSPKPGDGVIHHLIGRRMPPIDLPGTDGTRIHLDALPWGRSVVYLYPLTGQPDVDLPEGWHSMPGARGCTAQASDLRDHFDDLRSAGVDCILGLSSQKTTYQRELVDRLQLPFVMLSDPGLRLADDLDLPTFDIDDSSYYRRLTLVVREGLIEHIFYPIATPKQHAGEILQWLRASHE